MNKRQMSIVFSSGISALTDINSSFDSGILRVCYTGKSRNNTFISKETFERCIPSIYNCPVVCRYDRETDTIGAHDVELVSTDDGGMKLVNMTHPVGVVPMNAEWYWEEIEDDSGLHEYLCVDVLLWKRQEAYEKIKENGITDESMEITVKEGGMVDGVFVIKDFEFTAFCLLGTAEPCFESASLEVFSCDSFKAQLNEMMKEFKETFSFAQASEGVGALENHLEGGEEVLNKKEALAAEYGLDIDKLGFSLEDFTLEELRVKFDEMKASEPPENYALEGQFCNELIRALESETVETCFGEMSRYYYVDYDTSAEEVYCDDTTDWNLYSFKYAMNGDNVVIDFGSKKRMKYAIVPFDEGEQTNPVASAFAMVAEKYTANDAAWAQKYQAASESIAAMEGELASLRKFKAETENAIENGKRAEVFARFEDLAGNEAFEKLREDGAKYSVEDLEEKCYAIRGRINSVAKFTYQPPKMPKLMVGNTAPVEEPYGGVFAEYGIGK